MSAVRFLPNILDDIFLFSFEDMVEDRGEPQVALGLEYINGPVVTILVSKTSREYVLSKSKMAHQLN